MRLGKNIGLCVCCHGNIAHSISVYERIISHYMYKYKLSAVPLDQSLDACSTVGIQEYESFSVRCYVL